MSTPDRRAGLDRAHPDLSIRRQCTLLSISRSGVYRCARPGNDDDDLGLMRRIDELFLAYPFLGSRRMAAMLSVDGERVNRKRVQRLMRKMGIAALGPKPRTTKSSPGHKIFPYLLSGLTIERPNQVWAADITYIPIGRGFLYLVADHGLGEPGGAVVAAVEHHGHLVLRCGARTGAFSLWAARDIQYRPGQSVHQRRLHWDAGRRRDQNLHGRSWTLDGQRLH